MRETIEATEDRDEADEADETATGSTESRFDAFVRTIREQGHEVTLASEIDQTEAAERVRKKYRRRAIREKLMFNRPPE